MSSRSLRPMGRKLGVAALTATLGFAGLGLAAAPMAAADTVPEVEDDCGRLAGQTRFGTAGAIADAYESASDTDTAIIANGFNFPDALAASGLAAELDAPVLLTNQDSVPLETASALEDLGISNVVIVGGTAAVGQAVEDALDADYNVDRVAGLNRYETARDIALEIDTVGQLNGRNTAIIATGNNYPDALAGGPIAYHGDGTNPFPILLTDGGNIPPATVQALQAHQVTQAIILGGTDAVPASVEAALAAGMQNPPIRLAGETREGTAQAVADFAVDTLGFDTDAVLLADGRLRFPSPDALSGGPLGGLVEAPILLVNPGMPAQTQEFIEDNADSITQVIALGGTLAVPTEVLEAGCEAAGITDAATTGVTTRPELVSAAIGNTVTAGQEALPTNPQGTRVTYTFDENIDLFLPNHGNFHVYNADGNRAASGTGIISRSGNTVVVNFGTLNTAASVANLTLATVDFDAVRDNQGQVNPEGDAPIGTASAPGTTGTAGITTAPDLLTVGDFRAAATAGFTAVNFTFDEAAFVANSGGFDLIRINGTPIDCVGPTAANTNPGGGTSVGGNGTTVITVICPNDGATPLTAAGIARGVVDAGTVGDAAGGTGNLNVLQAADVTNNGITPNPDLVSAEFRPGTGGAVDQVLFVFDEPIATATATSLRVYNTNAVSTPGQGTAAINPANRTQVLVDFAPGTLATAVGAHVPAGAVTALDNGVVNERDEVGVTNTQATPGRTPGQTAAPQLTAVALNQGVDQFGNPTGFRATYTFDEAVQLTVDATKFYLYLADGTRLTATDCARVNTTADTPPQPAGTAGRDQVRCTGYGLPAATASATIGSAVLGTVDNGAVLAADNGQTNPEGAERTTGGTGTPAQ